MPDISLYLKNNRVVLLLPGSRIFQFEPDGDLQALNGTGSTQITLRKSENAELLVKDWEFDEIKDDSNATYGSTRDAARAAINDNVLNLTVQKFTTDMDVNDKDIVSSSNGDIVLDPNGTGSIVLRADNVKMEGRLGTSVSSVKFYEFGILEGNYIALKAPFSVTSDVTFTLPATDGSTGQVLKTNGSAVLGWQDALSGVNDTLTGVTNIQDAGGTRGAVAFYDDAGDNFTAIRAADTLSADTIFHLPTADGSSGQFLKTDGSGNLSFGAAGGGTTLTQVYSQSFLDNLGTTKHYLPFKDINEQTTIYQEEAAMLMPFDGKVRSVSLRLPAITGTSGNMTIGVNTISTGATGLFSSAAWTEEETETVAVADTDDHATIHFVFDNAQHFEAGDLISISIQCSTSLFGGFKYIYVSTILDYDTSNTMPTSSQVLSSNP